MKKPELPTGNLSKVPFTCANCKTVFFRYKCKDKGGRNFCSVACSNEGAKWTLDSFLGRITKTESCWIWNGAKSLNGYGTCTVNGKMIGTHRLSWIVSKGPIPHGLFVCHTCDNKACVNPAHLFLGTPKDNSQDAAKKGRQARGERNSHAKLSDANVIEIRQLLASGVPRLKLMQRFKIAQTTIGYIARNETWRHI